MEKESKVSLAELISQEKIKEPPSRYTEANLVKQLEKMEIGRPSTYASIIDKIQQRGYVEIKNIDGVTKSVKTFRYKTELKEETKDIQYGKEKTKFVPTDLGFEVLEFMETYFPYIVDYKFTANMEKKLDDIANGKITKIQVMDPFYKQLIAEITKISGEKINKVSINTDKLIGAHEAFQYYITKTKFGDAIKWEEGGETKYKSLKYLGVPVKDLTMDICLQFLKYPKELGDDIKLYKDFKKGNLFLGHNKQYYTIMDENITLEKAKEIVNGGGKNDTTKNLDKKYPIALNSEIKLGRNHKNGQFYLIHKNKFYSAPNDKITVEEAKKIIASKK